MAGGIKEVLVEDVASIPHEKFVSIGRGVSVRSLSQSDSQIDVLAKNLADKLCVIDEENGCVADEVASRNLKNKRISIYQQILLQQKKPFEFALAYQRAQKSAGLDISATLSRSEINRSASAKSFEVRLAQAPASRAPSPLSRSSSFEADPFEKNESNDQETVHAYEPSPMSGAIGSDIPRHVTHEANAVYESIFHEHLVNEDFHPLQTVEYRTFK